MLLGRVVIPQRVQRHVTTAYIPRQHNGQHGTTTTVKSPQLQAVAKS